MLGNELYSLNRDNHNGIQLNTIVVRSRAKHPTAGRVLYCVAHGMKAV